MRELGTDKRMVVHSIREFVAQHRGKSVDDLPDYNDDYDLFESGDLGSFGFVELLSVLSDRTGHELDLSEVDPAGLTTVGRLVSQFASGDSQ